MKQIVAVISLACFIVLINLLYTPCARCEYYEYVDKNGVKCFTDDNSKIPDKQTKKVRVHKEVYDNLTEEEKAEKLKADKEALKEFRTKQEEYSKKHKAEQEKIEKEEAEAAKKKAIEKQRTPVKIMNNQILVPVSLGHGRKTVTATLLLDTGASHTVLHPSLAEELEIKDGQISGARIADGSIVRTQISNIKFIQVGTKTYNAPKISIIYQNRPDDLFRGLLGQDFLGKFPYSIDYKTSEIVWKE